MKIYMLLKQGYEGSETVCVSEDINKIRVSICEDFDSDEDYPELEIWKNGEMIYRISGSNVLKRLQKKLMKSANEVGISFCGGQYMSRCVICGKEFKQEEFEMLSICKECKTLSKRKQSEIMVKRELTELGKLEGYTQERLEQEIKFMMKVLR